MGSRAARLLNLGRRSVGRAGSGKDGRQFGFLPTKVVDVDVADPVPTIRGLGGYAFALVLVRLAGETVGTVRVPVHGDRCPGTAIAEAVAHEQAEALVRLRLLGLLEQPFDDRRLDIDSVIAAAPRPDVAASGCPSLTVAVGTPARAELLDRCL